MVGTVGMVDEDCSQLDFTYVRNLMYQTMIKYVVDMIDRVIIAFAYF